MKRHLYEIFLDSQKNMIQVYETEIAFPKKCKDCFYHSNLFGCIGNILETGDCMPLKNEQRAGNYIFKRIVPFPKKSQNNQLKEEHEKTDIK